MAFTCFHLPTPGVMPAPPDALGWWTRWYSANRSSDSSASSMTVVLSPSGRTGETPYSQSLTLVPKSCQS